MTKQNDYRECDNCGAKIKVVERSMGVPGGKEREQAYCPQCRALVAEEVTDGTLDAYLVSEDDRDF